MSGQTMMTCDACGKSAPYAETQGTGHYEPTNGKFDYGWWEIRSNTPHSLRRSFDKTQFDACCRTCAKQIHAQLAGIKFDRNTAENEAVCLQWAFEQAGLKINELEAKTNEVQSLNARISSLNSQLQSTCGLNHDALINENSRLIQHVAALEEELRHARRLDREELAHLFQDAIRAARPEVVKVYVKDPFVTTAGGASCDSSDTLPSDRSEGRVPQDGG